MAIQIVMDHHGDSRHQFDSKNSSALLEAEKRFRTLKRYLIRHGNVGATVHELDDSGIPIRGLCFAPTGGLVVGDVMLAQKIALETSEKSALAVANSFPVQHRDRVVPFRLIRRAY